jgi:hypothetical protein
MSGGGRRFDPAALQVPNQGFQLGAASIGASVYTQQQQQQQQHQQQDARLLIQDDIPTEPESKSGTRAEKTGTFKYRIFFSPYAEANDINWGTYIRWCFLAFLMSIIQATAMARVASGLNSSVPALNSVLLGVTYMLTTIFALSWRQAFGFRLHTHQSVIMSEVCHSHIGVVNALVLFFWNCAGSAISGVFQLPGLLNCAAVPGAPFPASAVTNYWAAVGIDAPLGILVTLAFLHNIPLIFHGVAGELLPSETKNDRHGLTNVSLLFGIALFIGTVVGFPSGIWAMGNSVIYIGGAITLGASTPFPWAWSIPLLWSFVYGIVAFALHLLTFNVNGLSEEDFLEATAKKTN